MTADLPESFYLPEVSPEELLSCLHSRWYPLFRKHTPAAKIINLPDPIVQYLLDDGVFLPEQSDSVSTVDPKSADKDSRYEFIEFDNHLREIIKEYEGKVFTKFRWSAPLDAQWASSYMNLACSSPADMYLLMKASDFITHDLTVPYNGCTHQEDYPQPPNELVIKKFFNMPEDSQYRCFVLDHKLIAISHRNHITRYEHLQSTDEQNAIRDLIGTFFRDEIQEKFKMHTCLSSRFSLSTVLTDRFEDVVDIYITKAKRIFILDFSPWLERVETLLFTWAEIMLLSIDKEKELLPIIRFATETRQGRRYGQNAGPIDFTLGGWETQMKMAVQGEQSSEEELEENS